MCSCLRGLVSDGFRSPFYSLLVAPYPHKPMTEIENEKWYALYKSAMMEFEHSLVTGRIKDARVEISNRVQELRNIPGLHAEEKQAIEDAMVGLRSLERYEADRLEKEAGEALRKLRSLEPRLQRLRLDPNEE